MRVYGIYGGKYGFINRIGDIVIKVQYDDAESFEDGLARVKIGDKWGYIDKTGEFVIPPKFNHVGSFHKTELST